MNCVKCGFEIPDGSIFCPSCGTKQTVQESAPPTSEPVSPVIGAAPVISAAPVQPAASAAPSGTGSAQSKAPGQSGKIGGFFKAYFKNPIEAVSDHAKDEFWLWGLIILGVYAFLMFLMGFRGAFAGGGVYFLRHTLLWFVFMLIDLIKFATLIFALFLFQGLFKLKKKSLKSIVALSGLSFLPLIAADLLSTLFSSVFLVNNLVTGLVTAAYVFSAILIFLDYKKDSDDKSGLKSLLLTSCAFACMPILSSFFSGIAWWVYYL